MFVPRGHAGFVLQCLVAIVLAIVANGCAPARARCDAGTVAMCACPNGTEGLQTCSSLGTYGGCTCGPGGSDSSVDAGDTGALGNDGDTAPPDAFDAAADGADSSVEHAASATIGSAGGTVTLDGVTLDVPAMALSAPREIRIVASTESVPAGYHAYSPMYRFEPAGTMFARPVTIRMPFIGDVHRAALFWSRATTAGYERIGGSIASSIVTGTVDHFSGGFVADGVDYTEPPDLSCVRTQLLEGRTVNPSGVGLFFSAEDCDGRPVTGLTASDFALSEDGRSLSTEASATIIPRTGQRMFASLLLDMSSSTRPMLADLIAGAIAFVDEIERTGVPVRIAVSVFAGDAEIIEWEPFTLDYAQLRARLAQLGSFMPVDAVATNLNGAVVVSARRLAVAERTLRDESLGGVLTAGYNVLFTDGRDTTSLVSHAAALRAVTSTSDQTVAVALNSPDLDLAALVDFAPRGVILAPDASTLSREFAYLGLRIAGQAARSYLLGYCSASRAGNHTVALSVRGATAPTGGTATYDFSAAGFAPGCAASTFENACTGRSCGGLACGACDAGGFCDADGQCKRADGIAARFSGDYGGNVFCVRIDDGTIRCVNLNDGFGPGLGPQFTPIAGLPPSVAFDAGCALDATGALRCWGGTGCSGVAGCATASAPRFNDVVAMTPLGNADNTYVLRRDGHVYDVGSGALQSGLDGASLLTLVNSSICGVVPGGAVRCANGTYQRAALGLDNATALWSVIVNGDGMPPTLCGLVGGVPTCDGGATPAVLSGAVAAAENCVLLAAGTIECWPRTNPPAPRYPVPSLPRVAEISGPYARTTEGEVWLTTASGPASFPELTGIRSLADGCAVRNDGTVWCWSATPSGIAMPTCGAITCPVPTQVPGITTAAQVINPGQGLSAPQRACALLRDGTVQCWGAFSGAMCPSGGACVLPPTTLPSLPPIAQIESRFARSVDGRIFDIGDSPPTQRIAANDVAEIEPTSFDSYVPCVRRTSGSFACEGSYAWSLSDEPRFATASMVVAPGTASMLACGIFGGTVRCGRRGDTASLSTVAGITNARSLHPSNNALFVMQDDGTVTYASAGVVQGQTAFDTTMLSEHCGVDHGHVVCGSAPGFPSRLRLGPSPE